MIQMYFVCIMYFTNYTSKYNLHNKLINTITLKIGINKSIYR